MQSVTTAGRRRRTRAVGQALTEFALVGPLLLILILGLLDGTMLMYSVGTTHYAVGEAARLGAASGSAPGSDAAMLKVIRDTVGTLTVFQVDEIDIYKLNQDGGGNLSPDPTSYNKYRFDGTPMLSPEPWPAQARDTGNGTSDFMGVTIRYTYRFKAAILGFAAPLGLTATSYIRLEPQSY